MIPRILIERQGFVNITEDSLRKEIEKSTKESDEILINESQDSPEEDSGEADEDPLDVFVQQKFELSKNINIALNETSLSLDFVSLLISSIIPNIGKSTMSPHLLKNVPLGSLNSDRLLKDESAGNTEDEKTSPKVGELWKLESIDKMKTLFKQASTDLRQQIQREEQYWNDVSTVKSNDEVLFKTRDPINNARAIGVKYGYGDSGSNYRDKGIAVLRRDQETGGVTFNPLNVNKIARKVFKYLKIRILSKIENDDEFMITGQSYFKRRFLAHEFDILNEIEKARFFLFEEDLFYQLTREAKNLINYNVSIISNKIIIEANNEIIEIESLVFDDDDCISQKGDQEDDLLYQNVNDYSTMNNKKCEMILTYFKIMLCCYYKYNLHLKQKIPTAYTKWKQSNSHPLLLRPLIGNIRHEVNLKSLQSLTEHLLATYKDQLGSTKLELGKFINLKTLSGNPFQKSIERPVSTLNIVLVHKHNGKHLKMEIKLSTSEIFVNFVLSLNIIMFSKAEDLETNSLGTNVLQMNFYDFNDIDECLDWSIQNFINE